MRTRTHTLSGKFVGCRHHMHMRATYIHTHMCTHISFSSCTYTHLRSIFMHIPVTYIHTHTHAHTHSHTRFLSQEKPSGVDVVHIHTFVCRFIHTLATHVRTLTRAYTHSHTRFLSQEKPSGVDVVHIHTFVCRFIHTLATHVRTLTRAYTHSHTRFLFQEKPSGVDVVHIHILAIYVSAHTRDIYSYTHTRTHTLSLSHTLPGETVGCRRCGAVPGGAPERPGLQQVAGQKNCQSHRPAPPGACCGR